MKTVFTEMAKEKARKLAELASTGQKTEPLTLEERIAESQAKLGRFSAGIKTIHQEAEVRLGAKLDEARHEVEIAQQRLNDYNLNR